MLENLVPLVALVAAVRFAGRTGLQVDFGATLFFWARVAHVAVYVAGIVYVRTLAFAVATTGELLILLQLFR